MQEEAKLSGQSFLLSPFSAFNALAVLAQGAGGTTLQELVNGLHINSNKAIVAKQFQTYYKELRKNAGDTTFNLANRIYTQQSFKLNSTFQAVATQKFGSGIQSLNFANAQASANTINTFVSQQTHGKITDLFSASSLSSDTLVVIVNALYMKGLWLHKFDPENTKSGQFSSFEYATYMNQVNKFNYAALPELDATALEMPYANSSFAVVFILPNENVAYADVENKLQTYGWKKITSQMRTQQVNVTIPKVQITYQTSLNYVLSKVGINQIFANNANLNGILATPQSLKVSQVVQKCFLELDENGATAAAATGKFYYILQSNLRDTSDFNTI